MIENGTTLKRGLPMTDESWQAKNGCFGGVGVNSLGASPIPDTLVDDETGEPLPVTSVQVTIEIQGKCPEGSSRFITKTEYFDVYGRDAVVEVRLAVHSAVESAIGEAERWLSKAR